MLGEHRLTGKDVAYEEALQVPMLLRGPGIPVGETSDATTTTVDIAPTIAEIAGAAPERVQDGVSMLPVAQGTRPGYDQVLIQAGARNREWKFRGVRHSRWTYVEHIGLAGPTGVVELYDRHADPYQLRNLGGRPKVKARFASALDTLRDCAGASCSGTQEVVVDTPPS